MAGEPPLDAARRELAEEADVRAQRWHVLADWFISPGGSKDGLMDERILGGRGAIAEPGQPDAPFIDHP